MTKEELGKKIDDFAELLEKENIQCYVVAQSILSTQLGYARTTFKRIELIGILESCKHAELDKLRWHDHKKCNEDALKKTVETMEKNPELVKRMIDSQMKATKDDL